MPVAKHRNITKSSLGKTIQDEISENGNKNNGFVRFPVLPQRIFTRIFMILSILCIVYYTTKHHYDVPFAKQSETITGRGQSFECSESYRVAKSQAYEGCFPKHCGRFVSDKIITPAEADSLLQLAQKGFSFGGSDGGASILDLDSGALSRGRFFVNIYKIKNANELFNETDFKLFQTVKQKILKSLVHHFSVRPDKIYLTKPTFFSQITNKKAVTDHDEYWHPHVDQKTYETFHYTCLLYLNDYNVDFKGGKFIFIDDKINHTVEPKKARVNMFTSGAENLHHVEPVTSGVRYAMTISFTCFSMYGVEDPSINKYIK